MDLLFLHTLINTRSNGGISVYTIKLMNEFLHGAIWVYEDGIVSSWEKIDNDVVLKELNKKTMQLYSSYYEFDSHGEACWFNKELEKSTKLEMLDLIAKINARLKEINNNDFIVEDLETERLHNL